MKIDRRSVLAGAPALALAASGIAKAAPDADAIVMETTKGRLTIQLRPDLAPKHVKQIETLVKDHFYDGIIFHRVIDGFMAQTGDPTGTGGGGSKLPNIPAEFSKEHFGRGTVGMARANDPNSANSQFFICFADAGFLDGKYTIVGQVTQGMDVVDKINKGEPPAHPDKIVKMRMANDAK
ncbi:MAG: peptidylprolyl isomerase [Hyphomicrobiales bacterium]|nr:peptidylprolyl isomerase [Hyphomicrobiales bacterium]